MDPLLAFYRHQAPDHRGRWLQEIWRMPPSWLEQHHDYIQWLFPLPELSPVNPQAPRLTLEHRCEFLRDAALRQALGDLQKEGLIFKIHGKGTFVAKPKAFQNVSTLQGLGESMTQMGYEVINRLRSLRHVPANALVAARLQVEEIDASLAPDVEVPHDA